MAIIKWQGGVTAVAQVADSSVDTYDAASTYIVTLGDATVSVVGDTDTATTAANLVTALNAETHPYFAAITWSVPSGSTVRATADTAGAPFSAALTVSGGTGTVTDFSDGTACTGPHHADALENWVGGALPTTADEVVVEAGPSILYGLTALTSVALDRFTVRQAYTSAIGLEPSAFSTSVEGETLDTDFREYRTAYLEINADEIVIGEHLGPGSPTGSPRLCIKQTQAGVSVLDVRNTSTTSINSRPSLRYLAAHASADVVVHSAPGGLGIAVESDETTTIGDLYVADATTTSAVYVGVGVTLTTFLQSGGLNVLAAAATVTSVDVYGGELTVQGYDWLLTTLNLYGGTVADSHVNTGGAEWTTINCYGGTLELPYSDPTATRAYTTLNLYGGRVEADWTGLTGTEVVPTGSGSGNRRVVEVSEL